MSLGIIRVLGIVFFLYLMWRNLREDYQDDSLISFSWMALLGFLVGGRIGYGLLNWGVWNDSWLNWILVWQKPGLSYEVGYLVLIVVAVIICNKNGWKIWKLFEQSTISILILMLGFLVDELVRTRLDLTLAAVVALLVASIVVANVVKRKYRSFSWYKSGKSGFVWFFVNFFFWIIMAILSLFLWNNDVAAFVYMMFGLAALLGLFIIGEVIDPLLIGKRKKTVWPSTTAKS